MKMRMLSGVALLSLIVVSNVFGAQSNEPSIDSSIESLRADFRANKVDIINEAMRFNDQESKAFWPVYRKYEAELTRVNDQRVALIKSYADKYTTMTDADAKSMIDQSLDFESRRTDVTKKYAKEFEKAGLSPTTVARFLQLEHRLDLLVDLKIASELPPLLNKPAGQSSANP
ncbi:MAG TPA: hypothetical protein VK638_15155 [Edaphobacter sp.]|nr:hypothetical protein [Edaphobacter sp.]